LENALVRCNLRNPDRDVGNIKMDICEVVALCHNVLRPLWPCNWARYTNYLKIETTKVGASMSVLLVVFASHDDPVIASQSYKAILTN
jgi:hypothetical protein